MDAAVLEVVGALVTSALVIFGFGAFVVMFVAGFDA